VTLYNRFEIGSTILSILSKWLPNMGFTIIILKKPFFRLHRALDLFIKKNLFDRINNKHGWQKQ